MISCFFFLSLGTYNNNVHLYDVGTLQYMQHLAGHVGAINSIVVSPSGRFLFTGSSDASVMVSYCVALVSLFVFLEIIVFSLEALFYILEQKNI